MSKTIEALEKSIDHWKTDILKNREFPSGKDCALCRVFFYEDWEGDDPATGCAQCPLYIEGQGCDTYDSLFKKYVTVQDHMIVEKQKAAIEMIEFMEKLLVKEKAKPVKPKTIKEDLIEKLKIEYPHAYDITIYSDTLFRILGISENDQNVSSENYKIQVYKK
ncbi:MAG: hypothetical protein HOG49_41470 [Candidatus Scalindua sp.]|nr:hypothetical protein [Candidatus Scalindua sp.]